MKSNCSILRRQRELIVFRIRRRTACTRTVITRTACCGFSIFRKLSCKTFKLAVSKNKRRQNWTDLKPTKISDVEIGTIWSQQIFFPPKCKHLKQYCLSYHQWRYCCRCPRHAPYLNQNQNFGRRKITILFLLKKHDFGTKFVISLCHLFMTCIFFLQRAFRSCSFFSSLIWNFWKHCIFESNSTFQNNWFTVLKIIFKI